MSEEQKIEALKKALGEPIGFEISVAAMKVKRKLLFVSLVIIIFVLGELKATNKITLSGISLEGITPEKMMLGLAVLLTYSVIHYTWYCYEVMYEWSIRVTGTRLGFVTGGKLGFEGADYPDDPKQSTLYTWWVHEVKTFNYYKDFIYIAEAQKNEIDKRIDDLVSASNPSANGQMVSEAILQLGGTLDRVRHSVAKAESIIANARIPASLERFDTRFGLLLRSQNLRVLLTEILLPILMAAYAALLLLAFFGHI